MSERMLSAALIACALLACNDDQGLVVELTSDDPRTTTVELFIASKPCEACAGSMGPPDMGRRIPGDVWELDSTKIFNAHTTNGVASFLLVADDEDYAPLIEALSFDDQGQVTGSATLPKVTIPRDHVEHWRIPLHAVGPFTPFPLDANPATGVMVWRRFDQAHPGHPDYAQSTRAACVGLQSGTDVRFLVPPEDPDCDSYVDDKECDPTWYKYSTGASPDPRCFAETPACQAGALQTCVDGIGGPGCAELPFCFPDKVCETCTFPDATCLNSLRTSTQVTSISCTIPVSDPNGTPMHGVCTDRDAVIDLAPLGISCSGAGFGELVPLMPGIPATSFNINAANTQATVAVVGTAAPCQITVAWSGSVPSSPYNRPGVIQIQASNGNKLYLGFHLTFVQGCLEEMRCSVGPDVVAANDNIWACAR